eukprot:TRINITY_DN11528_c0_g1_i3.p2 TRINITY_DN11528_c0_g1~~TRINITY_DN11528_c0_g1_i3.p2  ORF type:complete len:421 (+),score=82.49 TRINITY_DN11528_c0_g1_i3:1431-2693(+)
MIGEKFNRTPSEFLFDETLNELHASFPNESVSPWTVADIRMNKPLGERLTEAFGLSLQVVSLPEWKEECNDNFAISSDGCQPFNHAFSQLALSVFDRLLSVRVSGVTEAQLRQFSGATADRSSFTYADFERAVNVLVRPAAQLVATHMLGYVRQVLEHFLTRFVDMAITRTIEDIRANAPRRQMEAQLVQYLEPVTTLRRQAIEAGISLLEETMSPLVFRFDSNDNRSNLGRASELNAQLAALLKAVKDPGSVKSACDEFQKNLRDSAALDAQGSDFDILCGRNFGDDLGEAIKLTEVRLALETASHAIRIFQFMSTELQPMLFDPITENVWGHRIRSFTTSQVKCVMYTSPNASSGTQNHTTPDIVISYAAGTIPALNRKAVETAYRLNELSGDAPNDAIVKAIQDAVKDASRAVSGIV